ncbi:LON peptidase substrate-binding domain-containing protein [Thioalkalivibrio paradoxus]|uniref:Peptidase S16 n=1 Tax=Thioalkalivibrio paradoxus ARh 1 TaxID=713585 RepID=W0DL52_9GAMM|nr:LON peptidase substrate-binding domain-containing protein [Thioalkalivibrio paradoxus]AHE99319.1 peptidase S16 [Thioalkalivibrio paradoxus ARh 1]
MKTLPVFPLNTVLFPDGLLPLRIFETRYIDMVRECMRGDGGGFVVVRIGQGSETSPAVEFAALGTRAEIIDWEQRPDGLLGILACGRERVRILDYQRRPDGLIVGDIEPVPEWPALDLPLEYASLAGLLERLLDQLGTPWSHLERRLQDSAWVAGRLIELLPLGLDTKQSLLEQDDPLERLRRLRAAMLAAPDP